MRATGDLGNDPAVLRVQVDLRADHAGQHVDAAHHQGRRGLVATGFDGQHDGGFVDGAPVLPGGGHEVTPSIAFKRALYSGESMSWAHITSASSVFS
ncbi:unannotated protein [freshwater metagenome]|uniref:Unannotated protein n=1 Tax=freshwater metagenome TaxID=449393 RepID=A0A6J6GU23_9ZZZZ